MLLDLSAAGDNPVDSQRVALEGVIELAISSGGVNAEQFVVLA